MCYNNSVKKETEGIKLSPEQTIIICLSGRGDKDMDYVIEHYGYGEQYK